MGRGKPVGARRPAGLSRFWAPENGLKTHCFGGLPEAVNGRIKRQPAGEALPWLGKGQDLKLVAIADDRPVKSRSLNTFIRTLASSTRRAALHIRIRCRGNFQQDADDPAHVAMQAAQVPRMWSGGAFISCAREVAALRIRKIGLRQNLEKPEPRHAADDNATTKSAA